MRQFSHPKKSTLLLIKLAISNTKCSLIKNNNDNNTVHLMSVLIIFFYYYFLMNKHYAQQDLQLFTKKKKEQGLMPRANTHDMKVKRIKLYPC